MGLPESLTRVRHGFNTKMANAKLLLLLVLGFSYICTKSSVQVFGPAKEKSKFTCFLPFIVAYFFKRRVLSKFDQPFLCSSYGNHWNAPAKSYQLKCRSYWTISIQLSSLKFHLNLNIWDFGFLDFLTVYKGLKDMGDRCCIS